ncbi:MAG: hypothetical protein RDV41_11005, partial [Planctomycetota bacterium]|nr:hypothetical protein [Planctomycetota bacterium]
LRDIEEVSYQTIPKPPRVIVLVKHETDFGRELVFSPLMPAIPFTKNKTVDDLIDRIAKSKGP